MDTERTDTPHEDLPETPEVSTAPLNEEEVQDAQIREELFKLNGLTEEAVEHYREQFGQLGWVSFNMPNSPHPVIFIFRGIRRDEYRNEVKPFMLEGGVTQDDVDEYVSSYGVVHPAEARDMSYWANKGGLVPASLANYIMDMSGAQPASAPMKL